MVSPAKKPILSDDVVTHTDQKTLDPYTHERPEPTEGRECPPVLLENGLVNLEKTPDYLVPVVQRNASESPLLRLPAEIRQRIFEYASGGYHIAVHPDAKFNCPEAQPEDEDTASTESSPDLDFKPYGPAFHLPQVCRQIYAETATLGYRLNTFLLPPSLGICSHCSPFIPGTWLSERNPAQLAAITAIEPDGWDAGQYQSMSDYEHSLNKDVYLEWLSSEQRFVPYEDYPDIVNTFSRHMSGLRIIYADRLVCKLACQSRIWDDDMKEFVDAWYTEMMVGKLKKWEEKGVEIVVRKGMEGMKFKGKTRQGITFYGW